MRLRLFALAFVVSCLACTCLSIPAAAQGVSYFFQPTDSQPYNDSGNWFDPINLQANVPSSDYQELAVINSGGTAVVNGGVPSASALSIGTTAAGTGTLEVTSTGTLNLVKGLDAAATGGINVGVTGSGTVRVAAGGTLTAAGAISTGSNANDMIVVGGAAALLTPVATLTGNSAVLNGTTQVFPNAAFSTASNVVFGASSVYTPEVNTSGTGRINAGNAAILKGTAKINFTGVTPTLGGASYAILEAVTFGGTKFDAITSNAVIPFNQVFVPTQVDVGGGRKQLRVGLQESIVLEVNRDTGAAKFTHPGTTGIAFDSYFITSAAGSLIPGNFSGLDDNNLFGGDWLKTSTTVNNIAELKPTTTSTYTAGTVTPLGNIYNPYAGAFGGASEEDVQFSFSRFSDGAVIPAVVKYTGTKINNLMLQVDPTGAGDSYLRNTSNTTVQIDGYHVLSAAGRLAPAAGAWNSLDDQDVGGANVWVEGLNNTANRISEFNQSVTTPVLTLNPGDSYNLGKFYTGGTKDLDFQFLLSDQAASSTGFVLYEAYVASGPILGDYNNNGIVDAADYTLWRNNLNGPAASLPNRNPLNGGNISAADYTYWKSRFGATTNPGSGSFSGSPVPEPTTWLLAALAGIVLAQAKPRAR